MNKINQKLFGKREPVIGWILVFMTFVYIGIIIDPLINDTKEFLRIVGMVIIGAGGAGLILMLILRRLLGKDQ
jgi:hypothetical protein